MAENLVVKKRVSENVFIVDKILQKGVDYEVNGKKVVCGRIIDGKQYVSTDGLLLKEEEDLSKLNWLR